MPVLVVGATFLDFFVALEILGAFEVLGAFGAAFLGALVLVAFEILGAFEALGAKVEVLGAFGAIFLVSPDTIHIAPNTIFVIVVAPIILIAFGAAFLEVVLDLVVVLLELVVILDLTIHGSSCVNHQTSTQAGLKMKELNLQAGLKGLF